MQKNTCDITKTGMREEKNIILLDVCKIEKILQNSDLQEEKIRELLFKNAVKQEIFRGEVGFAFLRTLLLDDQYPKLGYQILLLRQITEFKEYLKVFDLKKMEDVRTLYHKLKGRRRGKYAPWIVKSARRELKAQLEGESEQQRLEDRERRSRDSQRIEKIIEHFDIRDVAQVDRIYETLTIKENQVFESWLGETFLERLYLNSSEYQKKSKLEKRLWRLRDESKSMERGV